MPEVHQSEGLAVDAEAQLRYFGVRQAQKLFEQAQLGQYFGSCRVDGVAPEVAEEVGVLLQHRHLDSCPGQQVAQHHARRATAYDATARCPGSWVGTRSRFGIFGHVRNLILVL